MFPSKRSIVPFGRLYAGRGLRRDLSTDWQDVTTQAGGLPASHLILLGLSFLSISVVGRIMGPLKMFSCESLEPVNMLA